LYPASAFITFPLQFKFDEDMISTLTMFATASVSVAEEMSTSLLTDAGDVEFRFRVGVEAGGGYGAGGIIETFDHD
jgi:hypothetical protein